MKPLLLKTIKEIFETNDFFAIDYKDLIENFHTDDDEEKVNVSMNL